MTRVAIDWTEVQVELVERIRAGASFRLAADFAGVPFRTLKRRAKLDPALRRAMLDAYRQWYERNQRARRPVARKGKLPEGF